MLFMNSKEYLHKYKCINNNFEISKNKYAKLNAVRQTDGRADRPTDLPTDKLMLQGYKI